MMHTLVEWLLHTLHRDYITLLDDLCTGMSSRYRTHCTNTRNQRGSAGMSAVLHACYKPVSTSFYCTSSQAPIYKTASHSPVRWPQQKFTSLICLDWTVCYWLAAAVSDHPNRARSEDPQNIRDRLQTHLKSQRSALSKDQMTNVLCIYQITFQTQTWGHSSRVHTLDYVWEPEPSDLTPAPGQPWGWSQITGLGFSGVECIP